MCELLHAHNASPLSVDYKGLTALHYVAAKGDANMTEFLGKLLLANWEQYNVNGVGNGVDARLSALLLSLTSVTTTSPLKYEEAWCARNIPMRPVFTNGASGLMSAFVTAQKKFGQRADKRRRAVQSSPSSTRPTWHAPGHASDVEYRLVFTGDVACGAATKQSCVISADRDSVSSRYHQPRLPRPGTTSRAVKWLHGAPACTRPDHFRRVASSCMT